MFPDAGDDANIEEETVSAFFERIFSTGGPIEFAVEPYERKCHGEEHCIFFRQDQRNRSVFLYGISEEYNVVDDDQEGELQPEVNYHMSMTGKFSNQFATVPTSVTTAFHENNQWKVPWHNYWQMSLRSMGCPEESF
jgi:hypothetical protein